MKTQIQFKLIKTGKTSCRRACTANLSLLTNHKHSNGEDYGLNQVEGAVKQQPGWVWGVPKI